VTNVDNFNSKTPTALVDLISNFSNDKGEFSKIETGNISFQHPTDTNVRVDAAESVKVHPNGSMIRSLSILKKNSSYGSTRGKITTKKNVSISITSFEDDCDIIGIDDESLKSYFPIGFTSLIQESKDSRGRLIRGTSINWSSNDEKEEEIDNINYARIFSIDLEKEADIGEINNHFSRSNSIATIEGSASLMSLESFPSLLNTYSWNRLLSNVPDESKLNDYTIEIKKNNIDNTEKEINDFDFLFIEQPKKKKKIY
jgi:hypothetical protein